VKTKDKDKDPKDPPFSFFLRSLFFFSDDLSLNFLEHIIKKSPKGLNSYQRNKKSNQIRAIPQNWMKMAQNVEKRPKSMSAGARGSPKNTSNQGKTRRFTTRT